MLSEPAAPPARFDAILEASPIPPGEGALLGRSREGRAVRGFRLGSGPTAVSLLGGCHADEPVGPRFLRHLVGYLSGLPADDPWLERYQWWIVPHINPDGEVRNASWADEDAAAYDLGRYLRDVVREPPGDDIEFGFPRDPSDEGARPENRAVWAWWRSADRPFVLHGSLHGMGFAAGPWFLLEATWRDRLDALKRRCAGRVDALGYTLHDVERDGEKGFVRLGRGFTTRPDSRAMRAHFEGLGDPDTARLFHPSSMETVRGLGDDPLTLVSEMPLFLTPGVGETLGPPDPEAERWKRRIEGWRNELGAGADPESVSAAAAAAGLSAMPFRDQMDLQWTFIRAGLEAVRGA